MQKELHLDTFYIGDVLKVLKIIPDKSVRCCMSSIPYWGLRDYGTAAWIGGDESCDHLRINSGSSIETALKKSTLQGGKLNQEVAYTAKKLNKDVCGKCGAIRVDFQIGLEKNPEEYIKKIVSVYREVYRILKDDGTNWLNIGDSYFGGGGSSGHTEETLNMGRKTKSYGAVDSGNRNKKHPIIKPKDMVGIPFMLALALRADGWFLRQDIIWKKTSCMPESVTDRCTKSHEHIFLLTKNKKYYFDAIAIRTALANSTLNDSRWFDENYIPPTPDRNYPGNASRGNGVLKRKSGNFERKDRPSAPEDTGKHQKGSVPWEGETANRRDVWTIDEELPVWKWLFENAPASVIDPLWKKFIDDTQNVPDVWDITPATFRDSHFATFPTKIPELCIKAGTSEHGQCSKCGKSYVRITEKELKPTAKASPGTVVDDRDESADDNDQASNRVKSGQMPGFYNDYKTTGWKATCACQNAEVIPDVVLDPFMGAGTTALVAKKLNRNFVGIEINPKYVKEISVPRLQKSLGMFYTPKIIEV